MAKFPREVLFEPGQLVQVYRNDLTYTFKTERKLLPRWSPPRRIVSRDRNSYHIETLEGIPISSTFSSRRLRRFLPRSGTQLAELQEELEARLREATKEDGDSGGESDDDILDVGDGVDGGDAGSSVDTEDSEHEDMEDEEDVDCDSEDGIEEDAIEGNGFVEEAVVEEEGSRTRRGRRYDGGGHL